MLRVLCVQTELQEDGEVISVGDRVKRLAGRLPGGYFGTNLDEVEWGFDRYAELTSSHAAVIEGDVVAIAAVYVGLAALGNGWTAAPGTAWLEPLSSTATTRAPENRIEWSTQSMPSGHSYPVPHHRTEEGDEYLTGWLFTLEQEVLTPSPIASSP